MQKATPDAVKHRAPSSFSVRLFEDAEHVELAALRDRLQTGSLGHRRTNGSELVVQVEAGGDREADPTANAGIDAILLEPGFSGYI